LKKKQNDMKTARIKEQNEPLHVLLVLF
jgi:hypothetical protein